MTATAQRAVAAVSNETYHHPAPDQRTFRDVLGHFCSGITIITTLEGEMPSGFACQSFTSLSIDPPLVLFCVSKSSSTGRTVRRVGRFVVNVLTESQRDMCDIFGRRGADKFSCADWSLSPGRSPILDGVLAWLDCSVAAVHDGGDHHIVVGAVESLAHGGGGEPLLFHRGSYLSTGRTKATDSALTFPVPVDLDRTDWF